MENDNNSRLHAIAKGIVQGVGFRFFVFQTGITLQLNGWVRNRINGDVEILAEGPREKLDILLREIRRGPQMAQVVKVEVDWQLPLDDLPPFTILASE